MKGVFVKGAVVSAKSRHKDDRRELTVNIPETELNQEYWGNAMARDLIRDELYKQGLNSTFQIIRWIH